MVPLRMMRSSTLASRAGSGGAGRGAGQLGPVAAGEVVERRDDAAPEQVGERLLVDADRRAGAPGVAQRDDELGAPVVTGSDGRRLDDRTGRRRHEGGSVYTTSVGSMPPGASIVGARSARC